MTKPLSPTQAQILSAAACDPARLAETPAGLPAAARNSVFQSLLKAGLLEEAPSAEPGPATVFRITASGQHAVLTLLRRMEGATIAQVMEATGWAQHTCCGFLAGLKKGHTVEVLERVHQVGAGSQGAKGSYSIYRVAAGEQG